MSLLRALLEPPGHSEQTTTRSGREQNSPTLLCLEEIASEVDAANGSL